MIFSSSKLNSGQRYWAVVGVVCLAIVRPIYAQQAVVPAGGEGTGLGGTISFSVGQIDFISANGAGGTTQQGVQQPHCTTLWYADNDLDGFGNAAISQMACAAPSGYVSNNTDCNDADIAINPSAEEICSNGIDNNCDGNIDENCCGTPTGLVANGITGNRAVLNWIVVPSANSYQVRYRILGAIDWTTNTVTAPATSRTYSSLSAVTNYEWQVRAKCGTLWSEWSTIQQFSTICTVPDNPNVTGVAAIKATFNWGAVFGSAQYQLQYRKVGTTTWIGTIVYAPEVSRTISSLSAETNYEWRVRARCGLTWSDWTVTGQFTTTQVCGPPTVLTTTNIASDRARLNWSLVVGATNYQVQYRKSGTSTWTTNSGNATYLTRLASSLLASTNYEWRVRSKCNGAWGEWTENQVFTTLDLTPRLSDQSNAPWAFSIHPNPSNGRFTVTPLADVEGVATVMLFDVAGRVVLSQTWSASENATLVFDKQLDNGMYVLSITDADGQQFSSRVVIAN